MREQRIVDDVSCLVSFNIVALQCPFHKLWFCSNHYHWKWDIEFEGHSLGRHQTAFVMAICHNG